VTTETIDKLFLELSQVTSATTAKECRLLDLAEATKPFVELVKGSNGRIPVEKLSLADWHRLVKAWDKCVKQGLLT
jgi:hypothetical protein